MELVNIGFGNLIAAGRLIAVVSPDSAPIKRLIQETRALPAEKLAPRLGVRLEDLTEEEA